MFSIASGINAYLSHHVVQDVIIHAPFQCSQRSLWRYNYSLSFASGEHAVSVAHAVAINVLGVIYSPAINPVKFPSREAS